MTPEERARKILNTEIKFKDKFSPIGHFRRDLLVQAVEYAIREAEAAVHAQYEHLIEAASAFVRAEETDIYYRWRESSDKAIASAANGIEKELARLGRSVRANLKGK